MSDILVDKKGMPVKMIWLVPHPTHQFKENVKQLARMHNLRVIDAKWSADYAGSKYLAKHAPDLTPIGQADESDESDQTPPKPAPRKR